MHWNIRHDTERNYVHAYQSGPFSLEEQASFLNGIFTSPFWQAGTPLIIDFCSLEMNNIDNGRLEIARQLMTDLNAHMGGGRLALLCNDDEKFGVGRQFQSSVESYLDREVGVFRDEDAAVDWVTESTKAKTVD